MNNLKIVLGFFLLLISNVGIAQNSCDLMVNSLRINDGIIISAIKQSNNSSVLSKIDTDGNELWKINETGTPLYNNGIKLFSDGYIYFIIDMTTSLATGNNTKLVKVNPTNGQIIWKTTIIGSDNDLSPDFLEFNNSKIFLSTGIKDNNGGTTAGFKTYLIEKSTGVSQLNSTSNRTCTNLKIAKDSKQNIIYATDNLYDTNTNLLITKVNGYNMNNVLWQKKYNNATTNGATLPNIGKLFLDKFDNIYAFSNQTTIDVFKIESITGNEIWSKNNIAYDRRITDYKMKNNYLYVSCQHIYVGSVYTSFEIIKINLETGNVAWGTYSEHMAFTGATIPGTTGTNEAVFSFDIDCNEDVYATGYYGSSNYSPGAWGIMKINGATGLKINDLTITSNPSVLNTYSYGSSAYVYDNNVIFLGNLQYASNKASRVFVKTNYQLSSNFYKKYLCSIDSDGDSIQDFYEDINGYGFVENDDTDNDGIPNYLDADDDNDGVLTINEDSNNNDNPLDDYSDPTHPNLPDYLNNLVTLGTNEFVKNDIKIYPNPTNGIIKIDNQKNVDILKVELFSINGVKLLDKNENLDEIDISNFSTGIYILKIMSDYGVQTIKVIKE